MRKHHNTPGCLFTAACSCVGPKILGKQHFANAGLQRARIPTGSVRKCSFRQRIQISQRSKLGASKARSAFKCYMGDVQKVFIARQSFQPSLAFISEESQKRQSAAASRNLCMNLQAWGKAGFGRQELAKDSRSKNSFSSKVSHCTSLLERFLLPVFLCS